jgi:transcription initiation factor TFIIIB Brf1 subunit/transcription initiation factor TFIIB
MKLCPVCQSSRVTQNERGDKRCEKCGWIHHERRERAIFTQFTGNPGEESEIDKAMKRMGLE